MTRDQTSFLCLAISLICHEHLCCVVFYCFVCLCPASCVLFNLCCQCRWIVHSWLLNECASLCRNMNKTSRVFQQMLTRKKHEEVTQTLFFRHVTYLANLCAKYTHVLRAVDMRNIFNSEVNLVLRSHNCFQIGYSAIPRGGFYSEAQIHV